MRSYYINDIYWRDEMMNKIIIGLLVGILGINIYGFFLKDLDLLVINERVKTSESCANLNDEATFSCLKAVEVAGSATGNDLMLLGQFYLYGIGIDIDTAQARGMFERSVTIDKNSNSMRLLGDLSMEEDLLSAKYWYSRAAESNDLDAAIKLASIYRYGNDKDLDSEAALLLYKQVADSGSLAAQYELALMYAMGEGVEPNIDRSIFMLEITCDKEHVPSCELLQQIQRLKANTDES